MKYTLEDFQNQIGIEFKDKELIRLALTHASHSNDNKAGLLNNNERLEFLGDAVLELVSSERLYLKFTDKNEGDLSKLRASLVCEKALAKAAGRISLSQYIFLGRAEERNGGRNRASIVSDCLEAVIGAIYLDSGIEEARSFIEKYILENVEGNQIFNDNKTPLQEILQARGKSPIYDVIGEEGPAHKKIFNVAVNDGENILGYGTGRSKKSAEQMAARNAIEALKKEKDYVSKIN